MTNQPTPIESLLEKGAATSLTTEERQAILSSLRSYQAFHPPKKQVGWRRFSWLMAPVTRVALPVFVVLLVVVGVGVASDQSLPGQSLYSLKVNVVEPMTGLTHFTEVGRLDYQVALIEKRVDEIQALATTEVLSETALLQIEEHLIEHSSELAMLVSQDDDDSIPPAETVSAVSQAVSILRSQSAIVDYELGKGRQSKVDETEAELVVLYQQSVEAFVKEEPEAVPVYIEETLSELSETLADDADLADVSAVEVSDYLDDVAAALGSGNLRDALLYTGEAKQVVELNHYLEFLTDDRLIPETEESPSASFE